MSWAVTKAKARPAAVHQLSCQSHVSPKSAASEPRPLVRLTQTRAAIDTTDCTNRATTVAVTVSRRGAPGPGLSGAAASAPAITPATHAIRKSGIPQSTTLPAGAGGGRLGSTATPPRLVGRARARGHGPAPARRA